MKKLLYTFVTMALLAIFCQDTISAEKVNNNGDDPCYLNPQTSAIADDLILPDHGFDGDNLKNSKSEFILSGAEYFTLTCGQIEIGNEGAYPPLPPDFFGPGSEPFTGTIDLFGANSQGTTMPEVDLHLERLSDVNFSEPLPDDQIVLLDIPVLLVQGAEPVAVDMGGFDSFFDVFVEIEMPKPEASSQVITKQDEWGGEFTTTLSFYPRFIFTQVDDPSNVVIFSPLEMGYEPLTLTQADLYDWTHSPIPNSFDPIGEDFLVLKSGENNVLYLSPLLQRMDDFMVEMTEEGFAGQFGGTGFAEGQWFEYPNYGWWNVWFYDHPVNNSRRKEIKANMIIEPRNPDFPTEVEIVFNWSTPNWPGYPEVSRPPLPEDVPDPQIEDLYIERSETIFVHQGNLFEPILIDNIIYQIPDFNPEWLSIDIRGFNYILSGNIIHTCFKEKDCDDPVIQPSGLFLRPTFKADPEPWYAWIGNVNDTTPVQLFADDPDEQIASVNFFYSHSLGSKSWNLFYTDNDGFSYPAPGPTNSMQEEADGWSGYLPHEILDQSLLPLFFMAEAVTIDGTVVDVINEEPIMYDPTPPSSFESSLEEGFVTDEEVITISIMPELANLDSVIFEIEKKPEWYQKDVPHAEQQDDMSCGPYALAACLKTFANAGYPNIDGGLSVGDLAEALKPYVKYDAEKGTKDTDMANGARKWIKEHGNGFKVSGPMPYNKFNSTNMRNKLEGDGLINGIEQDIIQLFMWTETNAQGKVDTVGHFMTMSSVHNSPKEGKRRFDYMDPGDGLEEYIEGDINESSGTCSGFDDNYPPNGAKIFSTIMICPNEPVPSVTGTGTVTQGPLFPPVDVLVSDTGKSVVRTRAIDNDGHKSERTTVITRVTKASCPDTTVRAGSPPFVPQGANPPGGSFDGPGFQDSLFFPTDTGYYEVTYSYTYQIGFTSVGDFTIRVVGMDFGDAPDDPYPTLFVNDGARHIIDGVTYLGDTIDWEFDGQPTANADGDDVNDQDDEDGVTFLSALIPGKPAQINVNASVNGGLSAWIDFNQNGSWADVGEKIFADEMLTAGDNNLTFLVPTNALKGSTYARFRFSSQQSGLSFTGLAENGEVEDYKIEIIENETIKWIQEPNTEFHGYHANQQEGPDLFIADDWKCEGGEVTDLHWWGYYEAPNTGPCAGFRITIYDNDASGPYNKPGGMILTWDAPFGTNPGEVGEYYTGIKAITLDDLYYYYFVLPEPFAQIEGNFYWLELMALSANPQNNVIWEWQTNGETMVLSPPIQRDETGYEAQLDRNMAFIITSEQVVGEDYDFGDAPDQPYPTLLASNGARHFVDGQTYLGNAIDTEPDGMPNMAATGDDLNNVFDEDGVTFIEPFVVGETAEIKVKASVDGYLNAWIDFNMNGSWIEADEHIFNNTPLTSGMNTLTFDIPEDIKPGATYIRFRFNTTGGLNYYGSAENGEVEDYRLIIHPPDWGYTPTGSSHIISIPTSITFNCVSLSQGDFLGTFYLDENGNPACGGATFWDGINNQTLVAFGDDVTTTTIKEGFDENEDFTWRAYYSNSATEEEILVTYNPALPHSDGKFHDNGISALMSVIKKLGVTASATPAVLCEGETTQLAANVSGGCGANNFAWTSNPVGFTSSQQNPSDTPTVNTTYIVTVSNAFGDAAFDSVTVIVNPKPTVTCPDDFAVCPEDGPITLSGGLPSGGTYSGTGVTAGIFYPNSVGPGNHPIMYTYTDPDTGCSDSCTFIVIVNNSPLMDCPPFMEACEDDPMVLLNNAYPLGGDYTGTGVFYDGTDYWFDPSVGPGTYIINYCFTDPDTGCENCCEFNFYVYAKPDVSCPEDFTICIDTSPFALTGGLPSGGTYTGTGVSGGVFDPAAAGAGDHLITYTYTDPQTLCTSFCTFTITVIKVEVECPEDMIVCLDDPAIMLTGGLPAGGTYSGPGVSGGGMFTPSTAGVGVHTLTYTYVEPGTNCFGSCDFQIEVKPLPQMDCPPFMEACEDDPMVLLNNAYPLGGDYTGTGVFYDGTDYWFDPSVGPGTYIINYCFTDPDTGCENCCEFNFYVYAKPDVSCPEDFTICIDTSPFALTGGLPSGGTYTGTGVSGGIFDPAAAGAGTHLITYTYTDPQTLCTSFCTFTITVIKVEVECPEDMIVCLDDPAFMLTGGLPAGGTYSGPGVSGGGMFTPSTAGVGVHTLTYTYVEPGTNCFGSCDFQIEVKPLPQMDCPPYMEACEDDPMVLLNNAYPLGGDYTGTGVFYDGTDYWFDPSVGPGTYIINYCFTDPDTGCENCCEFNFYVYAKPDVSCPEDFTICIDTSPFALTGGLPSGGTYTGTGVSGGVFDPAAAGAGDHLITYTYTDPQTLCTNFCTFTITVIKVEVECPEDMIVCLDDPAFMLTGGLPAGGTYSGPGVSGGGMFTPSTAGVGVHTLTYTYVEPGTNCSGSCDFQIEVKPLPQMDCPPFMEACEDDPMVLLNNAYPLGGDYTGTGVFYDGTDYWFDPAVGPGTYILLYCFTDPDTGCENCCEFNFYVYAKPVVDCPDDFAVCLDTPVFTLSGATPAGGEYSGSGVSFDGTDFYFDPASVGAGSWEITYTYTDPQTQCTNFCMFEITVIDLPDVVCPGDMMVCVNDAAFELSGAIPEGGTYSGTGVSGGFFDPSTAGVGTHVITYTVGVAGTNCYGQCEFEIAVEPLPVMDCPPYMEACEDDPPVLLNNSYPLGGVYSGTGVYFDGTDYWFDPAIGSGTFIINYCYTNPATGCENCCEYNFIVYPKPTVTCPDDFAICIDDSPFALSGGNPSGGNYSGTGVSGGVFDPATAGEGDHVITYTYTDPQTLCTNFCAFTITVVYVEVECPDDMEMCVNDGPVALTGGFPTGGTYAGSGVSGGVFYPSISGIGMFTITYTYVAPGTNCFASCEFDMVVHALPQLDCPPYMEACEDDPLVLLNSSYPLGGEYSGTGVSFDGTDYWFDPAVGAGTYLINYCYTDPATGCENCCEFNFYVYAKPLVYCPDDFAVCMDTPAFVLTGATPAGGEYSGVGVTFDGTDYWFDPAIAGSGGWEITYTYTDPQTQCTNFCTYKISVIDLPEVVCPDNMMVCVNDPAFELTGATPEGGTYSGTGVSGGIFDPSIAGVGTHIITYTVGVVGTNCFGQCEFEIAVKSLPNVDCPADMEVCLESPTILIPDNGQPDAQFSGVGVFFDSGFYYFDPSVGVGEYEITMCVTDPQTGCTGCCIFYITVVADHIIAVNEGWSGISSYIEPDNPGMDAVMYPLTYDLVIIQNFDGIYWPGGNTFTLQTWDPYSGYAIKVLNDTEVPMCGDEVMDKSITLEQGWNIIPVLSTTPMDIENLFDGVDGFVLAKDVAGVGVYWKEFGINGIGNVVPGSAYYVKMDQPGTIVYDGNPVASITPSQGKPMDIDTPWNNVAHTPGSHVVVFNEAENNLLAGDVIGGFTADGTCAGITQVMNFNQPFTLNLNPDDAQTAEKDGFDVGETLSFRVYRSSTGETFQLSVTYNPERNEGLFETHGISEVTTVKLSATAIGDMTHPDLNIYPNPSNGLFNIDGHLENAVLSIFNTYGEEIVSGQFIRDGVINLTSQPNGVYIVRIETEAGSTMMKLVKE